MSHIPVIGICAHSSGMGKTSLLTAVLPMLSAMGYRVSIIKQAHAEFDLDRPGKDSYRMREAGAAQVLLSSPKRWALLTEHALNDEDSRLLELVGHLDPDQCDLVLVEGFRKACIPKIEVFRAGCGLIPLAHHDRNILAVASDVDLLPRLPLLNLNNPQQVAGFIADWLKSRQRHAPAGQRGSCS